MEEIIMEEIEADIHQLVYDSCAWANMDKDCNPDNPEYIKKLSMGDVNLIMEKIKFYIASADLAKLKAKQINTEAENITA